MFSDDDMDNVIMDTHQYMAWWGEKTSIEDYIADYRTFVAGAAAKSKYPVWFGEWALGTDQCAHWLEGFNNFNGTTKDKCQWVDCPASTSYLPVEVAVDFDRTADMLGPFGHDSENRGIIKKGQCSIDSDFFPNNDVHRLGQGLL